MHCRERLALCTWSWIRISCSDESLFVMLSIATATREVAGSEDGVAGTGSEDGVGETGSEDGVAVTGSEDGNLRLGQNLKLGLDPR